MYSEGSIDWTTAWHMGIVDQSLVLQSFSAYITAKNGGKKDNEMKQEMIPDTAHSPSSEE
jgi:hypothetical protein